MSEYYILIGQTPVPVEPCDPYTPEGIAGLVEWGQWFETADRRVALTRVLDTCEVSTIFLGLDHRGGPGMPLLFESMAFWAGEGGYEQDRCFTWFIAERMHALMVADVARPAAVLAYVGRRLRAFLEAAYDDWRDSWRELRELGPERTGDPNLDVALESLAKIKKRVNNDDWLLYT